MSFIYTRPFLQGKEIFLEGANVLMLDLELVLTPTLHLPLHFGGIFIGPGVPPKTIGLAIGVVKAYTTRVGGGPFPNEQLIVGILVSFFVIQTGSGCWKRSAVNIVLTLIVVGAVDDFLNTLA